MRHTQRFLPEDVHYGSIYDMENKKICWITGIKRKVKFEAILETH